MRSVPTIAPAVAPINASKESHHSSVVQVAKWLRSTAG